MFGHKVTMVLMLLTLSACAQNNGKQSNTQQQDQTSPKPLSEKCKNAKDELDKAVQSGQRNDLHELKRNIELYCVWRRY
jgi:type IV pilus biogenesis protein CpaD/CtpE